MLFSTTVSSRLATLSASSPHRLPHESPEAQASPPGINMQKTRLAQELVSPSPSLGFLASSIPYPLPWFPRDRRRESGGERTRAKKTNEVNRFIIKLAYKEPSGKETRKKIKENPEHPRPEIKRGAPRLVLGPRLTKTIPTLRVR